MSEKVRVVLSIDKDTWDTFKENDDEFSIYQYCNCMIPAIQADLRSKSDEELEKQVGWEWSPNFGKCGILVDEIPGPTRFERGLEELPCKYAECVDFGECWASIPGGVEPTTMDTGMRRL